jgi:hypothetical protein
MPFKIEPFGGARYNGHYADHVDIRQYLGLRPNQKLPHDMWEQIGVPLTDGRETILTVRPSTPAPAGERRWRNKSSAHRCFVICPDCLKAVPAGRTHQHKCKGGAA